MGGTNGKMSLWMHCWGCISLQPVVHRSFIERENEATFPPTNVSQITGPLRTPSSQRAPSRLGTEISVEVGEYSKGVRTYMRSWRSKESVNRTTRKGGGTRRYLNSCPLFLSDYIVHFYEAMCVPLNQVRVPTVLEISSNISCQEGA